MVTDDPGLFAGRYRLGELLGTGGSASVFAAVDARTGARVALKLLHPHLSGDEDAREALLREARAVAGLRHPNIVGVIDAGVHDPHGDSTAWIALELAEGVSLAEHVDEHGPLSAADTLAVAEGVLHALAAAHEAGLVHRDLSPANVMVAPGPHGLDPGSVRLLDFGLADATGRPALSASVAYVSPEHALGAPVDARGDLYQLGAVLYFALTGAAPFVRSSVAETMRAHVTAPPPVPSVAVRGVPRGLDRLVVRAMLKQPGERFASAAAMLAAVEAISGVTAATGPVTVAVTARVDAPEADRTLLLPSGVALPAVRRSVPSAVAVEAAAVLPPPASSSDDDTSWRWKVVLSAVVIVGLVAWIISSATGASKPHADASTALSSETPAATAPVAVAKPANPVPQTVAVPATAGGTIVDARALLEAAGFVVGEIVEEDSATPAATVLRSSPGVGEGAAPGATVTVVIASGFNRVPAVAGLARDAALAAMQSAGFAVLTAVKPDATSARGTVMGSDPDAGTRMILGRSVTILIASAPASTPSPTPAPTTTPEPGAAG